jgi:ABC-type glutathione transport system ATPase component
MKSIFNKGLRTIKFKNGSISPQQNLSVENEIAELLLKLYEGEVVVAGTTDDALAAELAAVKAELAEVKSGKKKAVKEEVEVTETETTGEVALADMKLADLKVIATEKGIDFPAGISKPNLLELIGN